MKPGSLPSKTLIEDQPWLLWLFAAISPWAVLVFTLPLLTFWAVHAYRSLPSRLEIAAGIVLGFLLWTYAEYLLHRYVFHWSPENRIARKVFDSFHIYHHRNPRDPSVFTSGVLPTLFWTYASSTLVYTLTDNWAFTSIFMLTATTTYYFYEWTHHLAHFHEFKAGLLHYLQNFHLTHHRIGNGNYGQVTPLWDWIFGTLLPNDATSVEKNRKFIVSGSSTRKQPSSRSHPEKACNQKGPDQRPDAMGKATIGSLSS